MSNINDLNSSTPIKNKAFYFFRPNKRNSVLKQAAEIIKNTHVNESTGKVFTSDAVLEELFPDLSPEQLKVVGDRLDSFAFACDISTDKMYSMIKAGKEIAEEIESGANKKYYKTSDMVNFDWYLRSQMAKMNTLYIHGTVKFPDPDLKFLEFTLHTRSTFHGNRERIYSRISSHWPELRKKIYEPRLLPNGEYIAFNKKDAKSYKKLNPGCKIRIFKKPHFGIDASNRKAKSLRLAGGNKKTFLIMNFNEKSLDNQEVPMIAIKNEGHSAAPITSFSHLKSTTRHGMQWAIKKGPIRRFIRKQSPSHPEFVDRKEDTLNKVILDNLDLIHLKNKNTPITYQALKSTDKLGSDYSLETLKDHLEALAKYVVDEKEADAIQTILIEINNIYKNQEELSEGWKHKFRPRSEECLLPTIQEMLDGKVPFIN